MAEKNYKIKKLSNFIDISSSMKNKQHQNILPLKSFIYLKYFFFAMTSIKIMRIRINSNT